MIISDVCRIKRNEANTKIFRLPWNSIGLIISYICFSNKSYETKQNQNFVFQSYIRQIKNNEIEMK